MVVRNDPVRLCLADCPPIEVIFKWKRGGYSIVSHEKSTFPVPNELIQKIEPPAKSFLDRIADHCGEPVDDVFTPKNWPNWKGPWSAAELISWAVFQETQQLFGCGDKQQHPALASSTVLQWANDKCAQRGRITVSQAIQTEGALLLRLPAHPLRMGGHLVVSDGQGKTIGAEPARGIVAVEENASERPWSFGVCVPGLSYVPVGSLSVIDNSNDDQLDKATVRQLQNRLQSFGHFRADADGNHGPESVVALAWFQKQNDLVVDGKLGPQTIAKLGEQQPFPGHPMSSSVDERHSVDE